MPPADPTPKDSARLALDRVFRLESGLVLASLIRSFGDFQLAEDAFSDAVSSALEAWGAEGVPRAPGAWLLTTARRTALDRLRRSAAARRLAPEAQALAELQRVVAQGGDFYLGVPIGRERVCFNAHRVLSPQTVLRALGELSLVEFSAVNDAGDLVRDARPEDFAKADYSCGLFHFTRR